jgi:hypothetical protein
VLPTKLATDVTRKNVRRLITSCPPIMLKVGIGVCRGMSTRHLVVPTRLLPGLLSELKVERWDDLLVRPIPSGLDHTADLRESGVEIRLANAATEPVGLDSHPPAWAWTGWPGTCVRRSGGLRLCHAHCRWTRVAARLATTSTTNRTPGSAGQLISLRTLADDTTPSIQANASADTAAFRELLLEQFTARRGARHAAQGHEWFASNPLLGY